jgi:ectoine hydroxylase-related dioxygenase (phytanoyl-CoA dioxygenase family)
MNSESDIHINYPELLNDGKWGEDKIILNNDINLLKNTNFDNTGYCILDINNYNSLLQKIIKTEILKETNKQFELDKYHEHVSEEEHKTILNSMPYKKNKNDEIIQFSNYLESIVSEKLNEKVKIFNGDLWFRICRPTSIYKNDFNPCHRDIYLDFYRNIVNIYLPVTGSNELSSLNIHSGSHKWNENETCITTGGAYFKSTNKKYSVDAIIASKQHLNMIRPNPNENQLMLFSPYLIHGCANNDNLDTTRISLEVRFIRDDENGLKQEADFNEFLKIRNWR